MGWQTHVRRVFISIFCLLSMPTWAAIQYQFALTVQPEQRLLIGQIELLSETAQRVELMLSPAMTLSVSGQSPRTNNSLTVSLDANTPLQLQYQLLLPIESEANWIDERNVFLTGLWYPQPTINAQYQLSLRLPSGFLANAEANQIIQQDSAEGVRFQFEFPHPLSKLHVTASKDYVYRESQYRDIRLAAYFFQEDEALIDDYLAASRRYLQLYEQLLSPYPFQRFAIVANLLPTGYAMPTYTLIGQRVLRLPFIIDTSLGHEILHQWLGNYVYGDYQGGNWTEGLTLYLAEHYYQTQAGHDAAYRKEILLKYQAYWLPEMNATDYGFALRQSKLTRAVAYNKGMLLFHMLRQQLGEAQFLAGVRQLLAQYAFQAVNWQMLERVFAQVAEQDLSPFFQQWLDRSELPNLMVTQPKLQMVDGQLQFSFMLSQSADPPYQLTVPFRLTSSTGTEWKTVKLTQQKQPVTWSLTAPPLSIHLDPEYDVMRQLTPDESPPILDSVLGQRRLIAAIPAEQHALYQPLLAQFAPVEVILKTPDELTFADLRQNTILTSALDHPLVKQLFAQVTAPEETALWLSVRRHPYNPQAQIVLVQAQNAEAINYHALRLLHYSRYSELQFQSQQVLSKVAGSVMGIPIFNRPETQVIAPSAARNLNALLPELLAQRIVYIGEQHDSFSHHLNQLNIIELLHNADPALAIGLEMFPRSQQATLDAYVAGELSEQEFLAQSNYLTQWGYDYGLYKPILAFAKQQRLPLLALNIESALSRQVARQGLDSLDATQRQQLPTELDTTDRQYQTDLQQIFQQHQSAQGHQDADFFLQAQLLWDETMAETIAHYVTAQPNTRLVVLAGNGHIRHRYGIPDRVFRRTPVPFLTLVQGENIEAGIADYVLLSAPLDGQLTPRLGVSVREFADRLIVLEILPDSIAQRTGIKQGDVLLQLNGKEIKDLQTLKLILFDFSAGGTATLTVDRNGEQTALSINF